jgi:uncharacterized cupredoxin-like copper-binding protein
MQKHAQTLFACSALVYGSTLPLANGAFEASAHEGHEHFSAGEPDDPQKPFRTVNVTMSEDGKRMLFDPAVVEVRLGEQIRFVIFKEGTWNHEFILATKTDNRKHAELMKKFPEMEHDDPNAKRLSPFASAEILWKFSKRGEFEYACLIPGHLEGRHARHRRREITRSAKVSNEKHPNYNVRGRRVGGRIDGICSGGNDRRSSR